MKKRTLCLLSAFAVLDITGFNPVAFSSQSD